MVCLRGNPNYKKDNENVCSIKKSFITHGSRDLICRIQAIQVAGFLRMFLWFLDSMSQLGFQVSNLQSSSGFFSGFLRSLVPEFLEIYIQCFLGSCTTGILRFVLRSSYFQRILSSLNSQSLLRSQSSQAF